MLYSLGLRRFPPIDVLLGIAAGRTPTNESALSYLLANTSTHYITFDPTAFSAVSFIPATTPDGQSVLAKPGEVSLRPRNALTAGLYQSRMCNSRICRGSVERIFARECCQIADRY
jgi:hypothetical protein